MSEIQKLQREFKDGQVVHVVASKDTRIATFTTTLIEQDGDTLYVDAISFENKTVGFKVDGIVCCITVDCEPLPIHFVDVDITLCRRNSKFVHKIDVKNNGCEVNRRNEFRVFISEMVLVQTAAHKSAKEMVLKDLSYSGCGLIMFDPFKGSAGDVVHFVFNAEVDNLKYNLNIYAKIVRIDCIGNKTMLGCAIVVLQGD